MYIHEQNFQERKRIGRFSLNFSGIISEQYSKIIMS